MGEVIMTREQYNKAIEISEKIKYLEEAEKQINYPGYDYRLSYIEHSQSSYDNEWNPCIYMSHIQDILDKHDVIIRQEINDRIKELNKQIEEL